VRIKPLVSTVRVDEPRPVIEVALSLAVGKGSRGVSPQATTFGTTFTLKLTVQPNPAEGTTCTV